MPTRWIAISKPRRLVCDLLHFAAKVPSIPVQRRMSLEAVVEAREALVDRPSWTAIFTKALAAVSDEFPEFRRAYVKWPWTHFVEYDTTVGVVTFERDFEGESAALFGRIKNPASLSLPDLNKILRDFSERPILEIKDFRRALRIARLPRPLRRLAWWIGLNSTRYRARHFGTFGVSVYSALGSESLHPIAPLTIVLNYGVIQPTGEVDVRIVYDHRVMDGTTVARALRYMEDVLSGPILFELRELDQRAVHELANPQPALSSP